MYRIFKFSAFQWQIHQLRSSAYVMWVSQVHSRTVSFMDKGISQPCKSMMYKNYRSYPSFLNAAVILYTFPCGACLMTLTATTWCGHWRPLGAIEPMCTTLAVYTLCIVLKQKELRILSFNLCWLQRYGSATTLESLSNVSVSSIPALTSFLFRYKLEGFPETCG